MAANSCLCAPCLKAWAALLLKPWRLLPHQTPPLRGAPSFSLTCAVDRVAWRVRRARGPRAPHVRLRVRLWPIGTVGRAGRCANRIRGKLQQGRALDADSLKEANERESIRHPLQSFHAGVISDIPCPRFLEISNKVSTSDHIGGHRRLGCVADVAAQAVDRLRPIDALRRTTISEIEEIAVELRRSPRPGFRLDPSSCIAILAINLLQQLEC